MDTNPLIGLPDPVINSAAASKSYVDTKIAKVGGNVDLGDYLKKDGSVAMTAEFDAGNQKNKKCRDTSS